MNSSNISHQMPWGGDADTGRAEGAASAAPAPAGQEPLRSNLPDVVSGGNPLVAAANRLLNLIP